MKSNLVLLIEDQYSLRGFLEPLLVELDCLLITVDSMVAALMQVRHTRFDLIIVDQGSGDRRGLEIFEQVRRLDVDAEFILLTGRSDRELALEALTLRVAEILLMPYRLDELAAAVRTVLLRRRERTAQIRRISARLRVAEIAVNIDPAPALTAATEETGPPRPVMRIDPRRLQLHADGRLLSISHGDVQLLLCLARVPGAAVSLRQLSRDLLLFPVSFAEARELIKSRVHRLRRRIEQDPRQPRILLSVRGIGYCLAADYDVTVES